VIEMVIQCGKETLRNALRGCPDAVIGRADFWQRRPLIGRRWTPVEGRRGEAERDRKSFSRCAEAKALQIHQNPVGENSRAKYS